MILDDILAHKRAEVARQRRALPGSVLREQPGYLAPRRGFRRALAGAPLPAVIAELKRTSPSRGVIRADYWRFGAYGPRLPAQFGMRMVGGRRGERICELSTEEWLKLRRWLSAQSPGLAKNESSDRFCSPPKRAVRKRQC
jgi:hypothetical protein